MFLRFVAVVLCLASPAFAECLTADDFTDSDVNVTLQAGDEWHVTRTDEGVQAEYRDKYGEPLRWQVTVHGVYPRFEQQNLSVDPSAGNHTPFPATQWEMETVYDNDPPQPVAGGNFATTGVASGNFDGVKRTWSFSVAYSFDPEKTVTLSGCRYRAIGVNGSFHSSSVDWMGRWIYFPDLAVGIQTRGKDSRTGESWANGMIGLGG
ncbi:MAG: hypothetical protein CFE34_03005 [Rhodobacteraceae bacterium PARR1]|nr:MAG: hypothetical protein CFE34_03005 [Rhodobacteraceae bacterium PARR1]